MEDLAERRRGPFVVVATLLVAICVAIIAIPDSLLALLESNRSLTNEQAGWAYRLLAFFAVAQIVYAGMSVFRIERIQRLRESNDRLSGLPKAAHISSLARTAAALVTFTLVYGVASVILTGQRGGFWLFPALAIAQGAWYYRAIGEIARWKSFQQEVDTGALERQWYPGTADYCPPLTRGLTPRDRAAASTD